MLSSFIEIITQFAFVPKLLLHSFCVNDTGLTNMHASKMYQNSAALAVFNKYVGKMFIELFEVLRYDMKKP